ncbi:MAG: LLM class flavin-dependent oxidoreductase [Gammaproteobacteria bacterium]|nr:LLM class flavin-dependent oxidoreductase [Gammaproteobacteria bacterium]
MTDITFGWFLPTFGDTTAFGDPTATLPPGNDLFDDVARAADDGGFQYLLMPVSPTCWEATVLGAYYAARTQRIAPLIAIRAGYVNPTQSAKMFATLDQMTGGRVAVNLIAGISDADTLADGIPDSKTVRYEKLDEEAAIMKQLWTSDEPIDFKGKHYSVNQLIDPKPVQDPHPPFFLGGGSAEAAEVSAKHSTVHLFWGERPSTIGKSIAELREKAAVHGRGETIQFGMRMHVICRDTDDEAWAAAHELIENAPRLADIEALRGGRDAIDDVARTSEANQRVWELLEESGNDMRIHPHIWTGISTVRVGAGIALVGSPKGIADTIDEFIAAGCTSFCLSGYPHAAAAREFAEKVMVPHFGTRMAKGLPKDRLT